MSTERIGGKDKILPLLAEYCADLHGEVESPDNSHFTGEAVHHDPTHAEKSVHFALHGGKSGWRKRFRAKHPEVNLGV